MNKLAHWTTDTHLNFNINTGFRRKFFQSIKNCKTPIIITGDIGDGRSLEHNLNTLAESTDSTIYFITGNHDYYHSSFKRTQEIIDHCVLENPNLVYLPKSWVVGLSSDTCIIGPEGWYDGKIVPDLVFTPFVLNDFSHIKDLSNRSKGDTILEFQKRANDGLEQLKKMLNDAVKSYEKIIILSHPAPFGRMTQFSEIQPFYVWYDAGCYVADFVREHPKHKFLWLSGHTHNYAEFNLDNLNCYSQGAEYFYPKLGAFIDTDLNVIFKGG